MDIFERMKDFEPEGIPRTHAMLRAQLEDRVRKWPKDWGDDLVAIIYGDFRAPSEDLKFGNLGIVIESAENPKYPTFGGLCARAARVRISEKSVTAVADGFRRLNQLIGILSAADYGISLRWWCYLFDGGGGKIGNLESDTVQSLLIRWLILPDAVRRRVDAAMYWIREGRTLFREERREHFTAYAHYWNALECLVYAAEEMQPIKLDRRDVRRSRIREGIRDATENELFETLKELYQTTVSPTFRMRAEHAWKWLVPGEAEEFVVDCFETRPGRPSLYSVRNQINHGSIDVDDPETLFMIEGRIGDLGRTVWTTFWHTVNAGFREGVAQVQARR